MIGLGRGAAGTLHDEAARLARAGDTVGAADLLRRALAADPGHHPSLHLAGLLAGRADDDAEALTLLSRAIAAGPPAQAARSAILLAALHERRARLGGAEAAYRTAIDLDGGSADARLGLGHLLRRAGRWDEAEAQFHAPHPPARRADFLYGAGLVRHGLGDAVGAARALEAALELRPSFAGARGARAIALTELGEAARGEAEARQALAQAPDDARLIVILAKILIARGRPAEAADAFSRALALRPDDVEARYNLAAARREQGRIDEAIAGFREVVARAPDLAAARVALCMAHLPAVARSAEEAAARVADHGAALDALERHADVVGAAALADGIGAAQPFELPALVDDVVSLQRRYGALACRAMADRYPPAPLAAAPRGGERLRLGIVSGFIRDHSAWRLPTRGWVAAIDRARFALTAYHTGGIEDDETAAARPLFERFVAGPLPFERWRETIAADRPHALLYPEIGMDPMAARLAALRLAPVQCLTWGHPATSGYPTIDAFLSADAMEPGNGAGHYVERLVRLPGLSTPITLPPMPPAADRQALGLAGNDVVFWSGQSLHKYAPRHDGVFADIAARVPRSRFVFIAHPAGETPTGLFRDRLDAAFAERGLAAADHCRILPRLDRASHDAAIGCADIFLDTIGWSGCNTLLVAIAHGLPVVTLAGATMRARHGVALLDRLGAGDWVCRDVAAYVDLAKRLARDPATRRAFGEVLRGEAHRLDDPGTVHALEARLLRACVGSDAQ